MSYLIIIVLFLSLILISIGSNMIIATYRNYYAGIGFVIVLSYMLFATYTLLEIFIYFSATESQALNISRLSSAVLGIAFYLLHYFHDEISAEYHQRKTMTLGSVLLGIVVGGTFLDGSIEIDPELHAPKLHPLYALAFVFQGILVIYRLSEHNMQMGRLSEHYGIETSFTIEARKKLRFRLYVLAGITLISLIFGNRIVSTPFTFIISISLFSLAYLYKHDSLSSLPISQTLDAIAIINDGKVEFLHQFSKIGFQIDKQQDFGSFMTSIGKFFVEIMKSDSRVKSISTQDMEVIFEELNEGYLVLISDERTPLIQKILKLTADSLNKNKPTSLDEFKQIVTKQLIRLET